MKLNLTESFTKLLKQLSLNENDLYCRTCGKLLADKEVLEKLEWNGRYNKRGYPTLKNLPTFYNEIQWVIRGRIINNKLYHRHTCWNCYIKELFKHEDVYRRAKKSSYYKKLVNEGFAIPMSSCTPNSTFKYLFDVTDDDLAEEKLKFDTASKESWIRRHGEEEGLRKYEEYRERQRYTASSEYFIKEKGMTPEQAKAFHATRACTKDNFIKRYGEEDGVKRWNEYCAKESYAGNKLEYFIEKYGEEAGTLKYKQVCKNKAITLENMIKKYGSIKGLQKFEEFINKTFIKLRSTKTYSKVSQKLFNTIIEYLPDDMVDICKYATHNGENPIIIPHHNKTYLLDFTCGNKVIEFNGDYWHANPSIYSASDILTFRGISITAKQIWKTEQERLDILKQLGYEVLVIWEKDYRESPTEIVKQCIKFILSK